MGKYLTFSYNEPLNDHFDEFEYGDMSFLFNSGSLIVPFLMSMVLKQFIFYVLNRLAVRCVKYKTCRRFGVYVYPHQTSFGSKLLGYFIEAFFDLFACFILQMYQMHLNSDRLLEWYFTTPSDLTQTIIAIFFGVMLLVFLCVQIYIHARYQRDL